MTEDLIAMARESEFLVRDGHIYESAATGAHIENRLYHFATLIEARAVARTREECAKVCESEELSWIDGSSTGKAFAAAIRALGERT